MLMQGCLLCWQAPVLENWVNVRPDSFVCFDIAEEQALPNLQDHVSRWDSALKRTPSVMRSALPHSRDAESPPHSTQHNFTSALKMAFFFMCTQYSA